MNIISNVCDFYESSNSVIKNFSIGDILQYILYTIKYLKYK